jgi:hypothetical protein
VSRSPSWGAGGHGRVDPVPGEVVARAKAAFERRAVGPVAVMIPRPNQHAGHSDERWLRFAHPLVLVEVLLRGVDQRCDVRGRVDPPQLHVELELEGTTVTAVEDMARGSFVFEGVPRGLARLRLVPREGSRVTTEWFYA